MQTKLRKAEGLVRELECAQGTLTAASQALETKNANLRLRCSRLEKSTKVQADKVESLSAQVTLQTDRLLAIKTESRDLKEELVREEEVVAAAISGIVNSKESLPEAKLNDILQHVVLHTKADPGEMLDVL